MRLFVLAVVLIGLVATVRLAIVVAATPPRLWLAEFPRLVDLSVPVSPGTRARADWAARHLADADLVRGRLAACGAGEPASVTTAPVAASDAASCLAVLDDALGASPSAGELWLYKANLLFRAGELGAPMEMALRRSYQASPREGWIAAERVLTGLRLYPLLPADLQNATIADLRIVLSDAKLAQPLLDAYPRDLALRRAAGDALRSLPDDLLNKFVSMAKSRPM